MSRIPTTVGQVQPRTTTETLNTDDVGNLAGRTARRSAGKQIRRSIGKFFSKIDHKFKKLDQRIANSQAKAKLKRRTKDAERSAAKLAKTIVRGKSTKETTAAMISLVHKARKLDPNNPGAKAGELLRAAVGNLSSEDKAAFADKGRDWDTIATALKAEVDRRFAKDQVFQEALAGMHGITAPDPEENQQAADELKTAVGTIVDDIKVESFNNRRDALQAKLPDGLTIDDQGFVHGRVELNRTPVDSKLGNDLSDLSIEDASANLINRGLQGGQTHMDQLGFDVPTSCLNDLYRFDMHIATSNGVYHSRQDPERNANARNQTAVSNLRQLTGDDNATRVLAGSIKQSLLRVYHECPQKSDGTSVNLKYGNKNDFDPATMKTPHGVEDLGSIYHYGSAVFNIDQDENGDYRVRIDWTMHPMAYDYDVIESTPFPLHADNGVIKSEFHIEYIIDADAARRGELKLSMPNKPTVTFSGGLTDI